MKKLAFMGFLLAGCSCAFLLLKKQEFVPKSGDLLLTYPRSGTNWTIGILQAFSKRPVRFIHKPSLKEHLGVNRLNVEIDETLPIIYRSHFVTKGVKELDQSQFRLIFTLRNFKECIVKEGQLTAAQFLEAVRSRNELVENYFNNLRFFDSGWKDPKLKHLVIYEQIISDPQKVVVDLLEFLGGDLERVAPFFEQYDQWNEKMLSSYHGQHREKGPSSNNQPLFHSKSFPKEILLEVDALIQQHYPDLWEKYLKRYAEESVS